MPWTRATCWTQWGISEATAGWKIVVLDYNNDSKVLSLSINSATAFTTVLKTAEAQFTAQSFLEIGYHSSINRMTTSKVGDLFTFNNSLLNPELGPVQLSSLISALKAEYGRPRASTPSGPPPRPTVVVNPVQF